MRAVDNRLMREPAAYGTRLVKSLRGLWKLRVGDYRIVYDLEGTVVTIQAILHRREVYEETLRRWRSV